MDYEYENYEGFRCEVSTYSNNGNTAVIVYKDEEEWAVLTTNLKPLDEGYAFIDTNNFPNAEQFIKDNELGEPTGQTGQSGYYTYPLYRLDLDKVRKLGIDISENMPYNRSNSN